MQQGGEDRAGAGAEIEQAQRRGAAAAERVEHRADEPFGVGARVEHVGRDRERQAPELAAAEDARDRLATEASRGISRQGAGRRAEGQAGVADEGEMVDAAGGADEQASVEVGATQAG